MVICVLAALIRYVPYTYSIHVRVQTRACVCVLARAAHLLTHSLNCGSQTEKKENKIEFVDEA